MNIKEKRWTPALVIISIVVIVSVVIALVNHDTPGSVYVQAVSDDSGGAIIVWQNNNGTYAQHINSEGKPLWKQGGIQINKIKNTFDPYGPSKIQFTITEDGMGGAIITWPDTSHIPDDRDDPAYYNPVPVYSQRINSDGEFLWPENTTTGITRRSGIAFPEVIADGKGGAIFAWNDYENVSRSLSDDFLCIQKLSPEGEQLWSDSGILIVTSSPYRPVTEEEKANGVKGTYTRTKPTYAGNQAIVSDDAGGVIVFWTERLENGRENIYAQKVGAIGNLSWPDNISVISNADYFENTLTSDGAGGVFIITPSAVSNSLLLQHITANGEVVWPYTSISYDRSNPYGICGDSMGNVFIYWGEDEPPIGNPQERQTSIFVTKLDGDGDALWQRDKLTGLAKGLRYNLDVVANGAGGINIAMRYYQYDAVYEGRIYFQKRDAQGDPSFPLSVFPNGLKYQGSPIILSDGSGGAIIIAAVGKGALEGDMVYGQRFDADGNLLWAEGVRIDR